MRREALAMLTLVAVFGAAAAEAGLFQDIYRGLDFAATPFGGPLQSTADGTRVNGARSGRLRIVPQGLGPGYRLEFDRTFGVDARGRPETLQFAGLGSLTLQGSIQATAGYSGKKFRTVTADTTVNNLSYDLKTNFGAQDAELTGTLNVASAFQLNPLGFYDLTLNVSNANSQLKLNGMAVQDTQATNFDVGPISLKGNIILDGISAALTAYGQDLSWFNGLTPQSPANLIDQAIRQQLQTQNVVAGETVTNQSQNQIPQLLLRTVLTGDAQAAQQLMAAELAAKSGLTATVSDGSNKPAIIPEPGTLLLVAAGTFTAWRIRRR